MRGYLREGRAVLEAVRERLPEDDVAARAAVAAALGGVAYWQRDLAAGEAAYVEAVVLAEGAGDTRALAQALYDLSFTTWQRGRLDRARELARRASALFVEGGDADGTARVLWLQGILDLIGGNLSAAEAQFAASVDRHRGSPDAFHLGWALRMLGRSLLLQGRGDDARGPLQESLRLFAAAGDVSAEVLHLSDFALLAKLDGDVDRQVRLVGAVRRLQRLTGTDLVDDAVNAPPGLEETLAGRGGRGARLLAEGEGMNEREASAYALGELSLHPEPDQRES
jgi:tetratricopeptide (TPR) repeat protein